VVDDLRKGAATSDDCGSRSPHERVVAGQIRDLNRDVFGCELVPGLARQRRYLTSLIGWKPDQSELQQNRDLLSITAVNVRRLLDATLGLGMLVSVLLPVFVPVVRLSSISVGVVVLICSCGIRGGTIKADEAQRPSAGSQLKTASETGVQCEEDAFLMEDNVDHIAEDVPGGPATPQQALDRYFRNDGGLEHMQSLEFTRANTSEGNDKRAVLEFSEQGIKRANVQLYRYGDTWYVSEAVICTTLVEKTKP
jgi:hypothetical protein